ncbi:helix-turn-helix domain-containing protein [Thomasclavelia cocleata]|uniref:helix-turn-helix domain-containing protein n=1 Tax=Thomasclavelia cocleata TaxID=69824 RepID=UPI00242FE3FA|nr:helix-turn-helix transcriptional regulator [Thomasclavelia cocleata]
MGNGSFPQKLKELRKKHKYTQHMLEILTGIDRTTISAYEKGTREPSFKNLIILADFFKVSLDYLCGRTNRDILDITNEDALTKKKLIAVLNNINKGD